MGKQPEPREPTVADIAEATLHWGKQHGKTAEQMLHLTDAEVAECYHLAREYARIRLWKATKERDRK